MEKEIKEVKESKKIEKIKKEFKFDINYNNVYNLIRDLTLIILIIVFIVQFISIKKSEIANSSYDQTMKLFYDEYANEIRLLSHENISLRESKIRIMLNNYIIEKYNFSVFSPSERIKYDNNTLTNK